MEEEGFKCQVCNTNRYHLGIFYDGDCIQCGRACCGHCCIVCVGTNEESGDEDVICDICVKEIEEKKK